MNKDQPNNVNYNDDEISLKELITVLLNEKRLIAIITIIAVALSALYSFVVLKTEYENKALISVDITTETIETPYGELETPIKSLEEYIGMVKSPEILKMTEQDMDKALSYNQIANAITTEVVVTDQSFNIKIKGDDSDQAYQIAKAHTDNFIQYLQYDLANRTIHKLYNKNDSEIYNLEKKLEATSGNIEKFQELLNDTSKTIDLENALLSQADYSKFIVNGKFDSNAFKGQRIISQAVNPSYITIDNKIVELKMERDELLNTIEVAEKNLEVLAQDKQTMEGYEEIPATEELNEGVLGAMENLVFIDQNPQPESKKITPNYKLNIAIALVLGLMLGVFAAFLKDYWKKS